MQNNDNTSHNTANNANSSHQQPQQPQMQHIDHTQHQAVPSDPIMSSPHYPPNMNPGGMQPNVQVYTNIGIQGDPFPDPNKPELYVWDSVNGTGDISSYRLQVLRDYSDLEG